MKLSEYFPVYEKLTKEEREMVDRATVVRTVEKNSLLHSRGDDCLGFVVVRTGLLRAHITSEEGREITLYRLMERDICLLTASCVMNSLQLDIMITAERETVIWIIPPLVFKKLMDQSVAFANYVNQIMATRLTEVVWLIEQIMWKSFDKRLADFLLEESALEESDTLKITHEKIAAHMGTAREVVTRMLRYFQSEGMVKLTRGTIEIVNSEKLVKIEEK